MKTSDFSYHLPAHLIAQYPLPQRDASRMLVIDSQGMTDATFTQLADYLNPGDLIVLNDTRVIPARLFAQKTTGGKVEIMLERMQNDKTLLVQLRASKSPPPGTCLILDGNICFVVKGQQDDLYLLDYVGQEPLVDLLERLGHTPLPPYIDRGDETLDRERYQTVFSNTPGAVAAPTAGLHFTDTTLAALSAKGIDNTCLTLHVGAGTFQPVRMDIIENHKMHSESLSVTQAVVDKINATKKKGGRVLAVGTTVVRGLETAALTGEIKSFAGDTNIFIYPGFKFNVIDMLLTNFHLSKSTLLMLVCAFAGQETIMQAYQHAIKQKYRFYSYGDAMLINHKIDTHQE